MTQNVHKIQMIFIWIIYLASSIPTTTLISTDGLERPSRLELAGWLEPTGWTELAGWFELTGWSELTGWFELTGWLEETDWLELEGGLEETGRLELTGWLEETGRLELTGWLEPCFDILELPDILKLLFKLELLLGGLYCVVARLWTTGLLVDAAGGCSSKNK